MSLSKVCEAPKTTWVVAASFAARAAAPWLELGDDAATFALDIGGRMAAPWLEIAEDATEAMIFYAAGVADALKDSSGHGRSCEGEVPDDCGSKIYFALLAASLCVSPVSILTGSIVLASVSIPLTIVMVGVDIVLMVGCYKFYVASKDLPEKAKRCYHRAMAVVGISAAVNLIILTGALPALQNGLNMLAAHYGLPFSVADVVPSALGLYFLAQCATGPLIIRNIGVIGGSSIPPMIPAYLTNLWATSCMIISTHHFPLVFCGLATCSTGLSCMAMTAANKFSHLLSVSNKSRSEFAIDVMAFTWTLAPMTQGLWALGVLPSAAVLPLIIVTDIPAKFVLADVTLHSRMALQIAAARRPIGAHED